MAEGQLGVRRLLGQRHSTIIVILGALHGRLLHPARPHAAPMVEREIADAGSGEAEAFRGLPRAGRNAGHRRLDLRRAPGGRDLPDDDQAPASQTWALNRRPGAHQRPWRLTSCGEPEAGPSSATSQARSPTRSWRPRRRGLGRAPGVDALLAAGLARTGGAIERGCPVGRAPRAPAAPARRPPRLWSPPGARADHSRGRTPSPNAIRQRSTTGGGTIRLIVPCSSSSSMKTTPFAVAGRWRATTIPATRTRLPCPISARPALSATSGPRPGRIRLSGCSPRVIPVVL